MVLASPHTSGSGWETRGARGGRWEDCLRPGIHIFSGWARPTERSRNMGKRCEFEVDPAYTPDVMIEEIDDCLSLENYPPVSVEPEEPD